MDTNQVSSKLSVVCIDTRTTIVGEYGKLYLYFFTDDNERGKSIFFYVMRSKVIDSALMNYNYDNILSIYSHRDIFYI